MATKKQRAAVDKIVEYRGNVSRAMRDVGYEPMTAKNPKNLTESKGYKEVCEELGLTEGFLVGALVDDIEKKPQNRKPELELGFKVIGRLSDKQEGNRTLILNVVGESAERYGIPRNAENSSS